MTFRKNFYQAVVVTKFFAWESTKPGIRQFTVTSGSDVQKRKKKKKKKIAHAAATYYHIILHKL